MKFILEQFIKPLLLMVAVFSLLTSNGQANQNKPPNIVFILVDDLGYSDVGFMNQKKAINTPNIDKLAQTGIVFSNAYAAAPVCSPTRASVLTGKSPAALKITCHIPGAGKVRYLEKQEKGQSLKEAYSKEFLPLEEITFAEVLKQNGYRTGFLGKWHLAGSGSAFIKEKKGIIAPEFHPENQGFDINIGGCAYGKPKKWFAPFENATIHENNGDKYLTDRLGNEAVDFIKDKSNDPFLLYLATYTVHTPLSAPTETVEKHDGNKYFAMIEKLDENLGKIVDQLKTSNLLENTILIFYSDNGGLWGNPPLKDSKGSLYEGGIRVPLIISWPSKIKGKQTNHTPITSVDFFPTLLDLAGVTYAPNEKLEGVSFAPLLLNGQNMPQRPLYWHYPHHRAKGLAMGAAIREGSWKLIWDFKTDKTYLYNLSTDIGETKNLADQNSSKANELLMNLKSWQLRVDGEMPRANN